MASRLSYLKAFEHKAAPAAEIAKSVSLDSGAWLAGCTEIVPIHLARYSLYRLVDANLLL